MVTIPVIRLLNPSFSCLLLFVVAIQKINTTGEQDRLLSDPSRYIGSFIILSVVRAGAISPGLLILEQAHFV
jgi:hypothetical protein